MDKRKLTALPVELLPSAIEFSQFPDIRKYDYAYTAKKYVVDKKSVLVVTFYSIEIKATAFRIFFDKKGFITEKLIPERKWSNCTLPKLISAVYENDEDDWVLKINSVCANQKSANLINKFFGQENHLPIDILFHFQEGVRSGQLKAKHERIRKHTDNFMKQVRALPKGIKKWAEMDLLPHYIFYIRNKKVIHGYCSACKSEIDLQAARHNDKIKCPKCKRNIIIKAEGLSKKIKDKSAFSIIQKTDAGVVVRMFVFDKFYGAKYRDPMVSFVEVERHFFIDGKYVKYVYEGRWNSNYTEQVFEWRKSKAIKWKRDYVLYSKNLSSALLNTEWQYCCLADYVNYHSEVDVVKYLTAYRELPVIEYFVKLRLYCLAEELVFRDFSPVREKVAKALNLGGRNFEEVLSVSKDILPFLQKHNVNSTLLRFIQVIYSRYGYFMNEHLNVFNSVNERDRYGIDRFVDRVAEALGYSSFTKVMNYIKKQFAKTFEDIGFVNALSDWLDYVKHAKLLDYDITSEFILFPKKLKREHDRVAKEYGEKKTAINEEKISSMAEALDLKYKYEADGFFVRAPCTVKEIKDEGAQLKHCVGGYYIDNMAAGSIVLLFVRKSDEPDAPFFTLEYENGAVSQCRGFGNCNMTPEVKKFVEKWLAQKVKSKKEKISA